MNKFFEDELLNKTITLEEAINAIYNLSLNSNTKRMTYLQIVEALIKEVKK